MDIIINDNEKISEIQEKFNERFPFLKLEFFNPGLTNDKAFSKQNQITDNNKKLGEIRNVHIPGHIIINGQLTVGTIEKTFRNNFGINVQVFRKSDNTWLETSSTDDWTLSEENAKGEEMNTAVNEQNTSDYEQYHEQS